MITDKPDLESLSSSFLELFPDWTQDARALAVQLFRRLAEGKPVSRDTLAAVARTPMEAVHDFLDNHCGFHYENDDAEVIGFGGLALSETPHRFEVDGRTLYTWCAWDSLFIPEIINVTARVESRCPVSGEKIELTVSSDGVKDVDPSSTVMSFLIPDKKTVDENVMAGFCHFVHFFSSEEAGRQWASEREGIFLLSLDEAHDVGRRLNAAFYGDLAAV